MSEEQERMIRIDTCLDCRYFRGPYWCSKTGGDIVISTPESSFPLDCPLELAPLTDGELRILLRIAVDDFDNEFHSDYDGYPVSRTSAQEEYARIIQKIRPYLSEEKKVNDG